MSKRFLSIAGLLALVPAVSSAEENFYTGFYSGMNLGLSYGQLGLKNTSKVDIILVPGTFTDNKKKSASSFGLVGDALAGHRWRLGNTFMLGCELAVTIDRNKIESKTFFTTDLSKAKQHLSQKLILTPAFVFGVITSPDLMTFVKIGPAWTRFSFVNKNIDAVTNERLTTESNTYKTFGASFSIGAEYALPNNWSATATVTHVVYPEKKFTLHNRLTPIPPAISDESQSVKIKPSYSSIKLGFVYRY